MANLTKAQLIAAHPALGLKLSQTKDEMLNLIKRAEKTAKTATQGRAGER